VGRANGALGMTLHWQEALKNKYLSNLADDHLLDTHNDINFHTDMTAALPADHRTHYSIRSNATYETVRGRAALP
jgi:hypothetical protein